MKAVKTYLSYFGWWNPLNIIYIFLLHILYSEQQVNQKVVEQIEVSLQTIRWVEGPRVKGSFGSGYYKRYSVRPQFLRELVPDFCDKRLYTIHDKGCASCYDTCLTETWWDEHKGNTCYHSDKQRARAWRRMSVL